jgi:chromosomal replication initiator protein
MQLVFDFPLNPKYSFANFVVCGGNSTAFRFAQLLAGDDTDNILYVYGPAGSGKTHLLRALADSLCAREGRAALPCISFREIDEIYHGEYPAEAVSKLAERFRGAPALLVDDIHLLPANSHVRSEFWQLFNDFHQAGRKIAVTGLYPPRELANLDDHLISRLLWGLVVRVDISDDDSRRMIMKKLASDRQIILPAAVIDYLLLHTARDIPSLISALERIRREAFATKRKITVRLAREALALAG